VPSPVPEFTAALYRAVPTSLRPHDHTMPTFERLAAVFVALGLGIGVAGQAVSPDCS
jgi:hypothetical protein